MREKEHKITIDGDKVTIETNRDTVEKLLKILNNITGDNYFKTSVWTLCYDMNHIEGLSPSSNVEITQIMRTSDTIYC